MSDNPPEPLPLEKQKAVYETLEAIERESASFFPSPKTLNSELYQGI